MIILDAIVALILSDCCSHDKCNSVYIRLSDSKNVTILKEVASSNHASIFLMRDNKNEEIIISLSYSFMQNDLLKLYSALKHEKDTAFIENSYLEIAGSNNYKNGGSIIISVSQIGAAQFNVVYFRSVNRLNKIQSEGLIAAIDFIHQYKNGNEKLAVKN